MLLLRHMPSLCQELDCLKLPEHVRPQGLTLEQWMQDTYPSHIKSVLGQSNLHGCQSRLHDLLHKICKCLAEWPLDVVYRS